MQAALKVLVVFMGILLVGGTALLVTLIVTRAPRGHTATALGPASPDNWHGTLVLDNNARILSVSPMGDRLVIHADGLPGEAVLLVDPETGSVLGKMAVRHEAEGPVSGP